MGKKVQDLGAAYEPPPSLAAMRALVKRETSRPKPTTHVREMLRHLAEEQPAMGFILATALMAAGLGVISPWVASRAIDVALPNAAPSMLTLLAIGIVAGVVFTAWTGWLHGKASVVLQERLVTRTQRELMQRYLRTPFSDLQTTEVGATQVTFSEASTLAKSITRAVTDVITQSASAVATLIWLGNYSVGLAMAILASALVTAGLAALLSLREMRFAKRNLGASSQAEQLLHTLLRAVTTLRVFHATDRLVDRWVGLSGKQAEQAVAMETTRLARGALLLAARQLITWTSTVWLVNQTLDGALSLGAMTSCTMLVGQVLSATVNVTQSAMSTLVQRPVAKRVDALCSASEGGSERSSVKKSALRSHSIEVHDVWYRYQPTALWVLRAYSAEYASGSLTTLKAASGAGKSTLLRLIAGLLTPDHGRVRVCGHNPATTVDLVAYVPQQSLLVDSSIGTNLSMLSGGRFKEALVAAEATGLVRLLEKLPMGLETLISGGGSSLSAGQRQLVMLTAACATEQPVLLLDEAVSQLDGRSRSLIDWATLTGDRTIISVQHF